ncbi:MULTISPECIES: GPW/gp25 family protein [unclassified Dysgonomonas]|jgi:phage baseplate assembly protein W|uniref:GPW/gp25 family protein n=1 Tax=unclassified Dysgonomonas TaxID=2630389 RepID=UPI0025BCF3A4|nr:MULTISPECIES: GPW/gp25 family protein [unclassified Dysgonomonas]MDR2002461.1 GPW/gp25 family protein [Prevotella sp.]HMM02939.1 GPW/gp25 family protein [Dysgonomonas sp.]
MDDKPYLGIGWSFPVSFDKKEGVSMSYGDGDIRESLKVLLSTIPGERIFRPEYGCNIRQWTFSRMNLSEKTRIANTIEMAILEGEPRIILESVEVNIKDEREGILWISIDYLVSQTNSRSNMVYPFYIREGTNL